MAKVIKKGKNYYLDYYDEHSKRVIRKVGENYALAQATLKKIVMQITEKKFFGDKTMVKPERLTINEFAPALYFNNTSPVKYLCYERIPGH